MRVLFLVALFCACSSPPTFEAGASLTAGEPGPASIAFAWPAAEGDVEAYLVSVDGEEVARLGRDERDHRVVELAEPGEHEVAVVALSKDGDRSRALSARMRTGAGTPPTFPRGELAARAEIGDEGSPPRVRIEWPVAIDASGIARYRLLLDGDEVATVDAPTTSIAVDATGWPAPATLTLVAIDVAGNESGPGLTAVHQPAPGFSGQIREIAKTRAAAELLLLHALDNRSSDPVLAGERTPEVVSPADDEAGD